MTVPIRTPRGRAVLALGGLALLVTIAAGLGVVVQGSRADPHRRVLELVRARAPGRDAIVVVARDRALLSSLAAWATAHRQIALHGAIPDPADPGVRRAFASGRVFVIESADTPALVRTRTDIASRGWGLTGGKVLDAHARDRFTVLQVSSPPLPEVLWVPPAATAVERSFWIGGTSEVTFELPVGPEHDDATQAVRAALESRGWAPQAWQHLNPLTPTSFAAGWYGLPGSGLFEKDDPARHGPAPIAGEWIGEWRDAAGNQIDYRFRGDGRQGRGFATFRPAAVIAEMSLSLAADRAREPRATVSFDGTPVGFEVNPRAFVLADPEALAARRDVLAPMSSRRWDQHADRLRASARPHRIAVGEAGEPFGTGMVRIGGDDLEPAAGGERPGEVVDISSGVLIAAALHCLPKVAAVVTPERVRQMLASPAGDALVARRLREDVGRDCFALVRATPGRRFAGNGAYRLRPGAPAPVALIGGAPSTARRF